LKLVDARGHPPRAPPLRRVFDALEN